MELGPVEGGKGGGAAALVTPAVVVCIATSDLTRFMARSTRVLWRSSVRTRTKRFQDRVTRTCWSLARVFRKAATADAASGSSCSSSGVVWVGVRGGRGAARGGGDAKRERVVRNELLRLVGGTLDAVVSTESGQTGS